MIAEIKDYSDVLVLTRGLVDSSKAQLGDGFQMKDLVPIFSENFAKAMAAFEGAGNIPAIWKNNQEACVRETVEFAVDLACDLFKVPADSAADFKETQEVLAAVSGITKSVVSHLQGGLQVQEYFEIVSENFGNITIASKDAGKVAEELKAGTRAFIKLVALFAVDLAFQVKASMAK